MIAYALVDSLVLHSGYSSLRLESFLFTEQAFRDVKGSSERRRRVRDVELLPPGVDRRPPGRNGQAGLRRRSGRHRAALSRARSGRLTRWWGRTSPTIIVGKPGSKNAGVDPRQTRPRRVVLAQSAPARQRRHQRLQHRGSRRLRASRLDPVAEDRRGRGWTRPGSGRCRPTTGRSSTSRRRRSLV